MNGEADGFEHLDRAGRATAHLARQPRGLVYGVFAVGVILSWVILVLMALRSAQTRPPGIDAPGDALVESLPSLSLPEVLEQFFALCLRPAQLNFGGVEFAALTVMWFVMSVAMMLPSAAPLVRTYCEIADTARIRREPVVHPLVLVAGYLAVWMSASILFAGATLLLSTSALANPLSPAAGYTGAGILAAAGLYQFTTLKHACLKKCGNPFATLFSRWSSRPSSIFRLGVEQGLWCLGCCWALMLVMLVVGAANPFWMALIAMFTLLEKQSAKPAVSIAAGVILLVWALALLLIST